MTSIGTLNVHPPPSAEVLAYFEAGRIDFAK